MAAQGVTLDKVVIEIESNADKANSNISSLSKTLTELKSAIKGGFGNLTKLADGLKQIDNTSVSFNNVGTKVRGAQKQASSFERTMKNLEKTFKKTSNIATEFGKITSRQFGSVHSKIKQVALSLLGTRTLFTAVRKAVSEYAQMDAELSKETTNLWRALGAQLAPAVEYVLSLFKQFTRVVYSFVYAVTGIDLIARANAKALQNMGNSAKKTLGSLQKFDDLNVADFGKGSDDNNLIELDKIDLSPIQKVIDWVKKLKQEIIDAWKSGEWTGVGVLLAEGINSAFDAINPTIIGEKITSAVTGALGFITTVVSNVDWGLLGTKIRETLTSIDWGAIWKNAVDLFKEAFGGLDDFFDGLFGVSIGGEATATAGTILLVMEKINKTKQGEGIFASLMNGYDTAKAGLSDIWEKIQNITSLSQSGSAMSILSPETVQQLTGIGPKLQSSTIPVLGKFFGFFTSASMGTIVAVVAAVVVGIMALVTAFKNLYENSESFRTTVDGLISSIKDTLLKVLDNLTTVLTSLWDVIKMVWQMAIVPLFNLLVSIVEPFLDALIKIIATLWENTIKPLAEGLMNILMPAFKIVIDVVKALIVVIKGIIDVLTWLWDNILSPIVSFLLDVVVGAIKIVSSVIGVIIQGIVTYYENFVKALGVGWGLIKTGFLAVYNYVKEKFVDPLLKAWTKIKDGISNMWTGIKNGCKTAINWILEKVEAFINRIIRGINSLSSGLRKIGNKIFDIIGVDVKFNPISEVSLPRLETGTNEIPYEGIYHLHPGEAVVPKKYNPALGGGTNNETNEKLDTLIDMMGNLGFTNVVNIGNETLYKKQQKYNSMQNDKYGTTVSL